jgi:hypothetical protein
MIMTSKLHPIIKPAEEWEIAQYPVRDDEEVGPTEDLDRMPDGVPHAVIGYTALFVVLFVASLSALWVISSTGGRILAGIIALLVVPFVVVTLRNKATRERDRVHPSR